MRDFIHTHRYSILNLLLSCVLLVLVFFPFLDAWAQTTPGTGSQANINSNGASGPGILTMLGSTIGNMILNIGAAVLWLGGVMLQESITYFVLNTGTLLGSGSSMGIAIEAIWVLIRDIANLAFIFGFIYIGIKLIIDSDDSFTKRQLAAIIIGALLINFSLFFTRIIVDVSNYLSVELYNGLVTGTETENGSISNKFRALTGVDTVFQIPDGADFAARSVGGNFAYYFMGTLLLMVAGFVLAAGAALLMIRFAAIILIMCFSPLLFAATVFPATSGVASDLWKKLISYSFFAPAYLLLLIVSIRVLEGAGPAIRGTDDFSRALSGSSDAFGIFLNFGLAIFLLIMALQVSSKFSIVGSEKVISTTRGLIGRSSAGLAAASGRATFGRFANSVAESDKWKDRASRRGLGGLAARQILKGSRVVADSSFDARNTGAGKLLNVGEGRKGGYESAMKEVEEKEMKFAKSLGEVGDDDVRVQDRKKEMEAVEKDTKTFREDTREELRRATDSGERANIRAKLEKQEKQLKEAQEKYSKEKQRRVLGGTYGQENAAELKAAKEALEKADGAVKQSWQDYKKMVDEDDRENARQMIEKISEEAAEAKKRYKKARAQAQSDDGYASVLENSGLGAWVKGRTMKSEQEAGEAIRKAFDKKIKTSKED